MLAIGKENPMLVALKGVPAFLKGVARRLVGEGDRDSVKKMLTSLLRVAFFLAGVFLGFGLGWTSKVYGPYTIWRYGGLSVEERCKRIQSGMPVERAMQVERSGPAATDEGLGEGTMFFSSPVGTCEIEYAEETNEIKQVRFIRSSMK